jgi:hypothetical protein
MFFNYFQQVRKLINFGMNYAHKIIDYAYKIICISDGGKIGEKQKSGNNVEVNIFTFG